MAAGSLVDRRKKTTIEEIVDLLHGRKKGLTATEIAKRLNRKQTTVTRELAYARGVVHVVGTVKTGNVGRPANLYVA